MIKRFLANALSAFFVKQSTFYSVYVRTTEGNRPLCQWFRGLNPPRKGEVIAVESDKSADLPKNEKVYEYYRVVEVINIFYRSKFGEDDITLGKKEGTIIVQYLGDFDPKAV